MANGNTLPHFVKEFNAEVQMKVPHGGDGGYYLDPPGLLPAAAIPPNGGIPAIIQVAANNGMAGGVAQNAVNVV